MKIGFLILLVTLSALLSISNADPGDLAASGYIESSEGFVFPDGSIQTKAAGTAEAWPQHCYHYLHLESGETLDMTCYSLLPEPSGTWGSSSGVPDGYYFLVTDVLIDPYTDGVETYVTLYDSYPSGAGVGNSMSRSFRLSPTGDTKLFSFRSPTLHLVPSHYLRVTNSGGSTVKVEVTGWITNDPSLILH